ncbi:MAG: APC family permease [Candidatus Acidifodinimicrobium sp.]
MVNGKGLTKNSLSIWGVIFYSVSVISPAFTFTVGSVASIAYAGRAAPLTFLIAGTAIFSAIIPLYIFSTHVSNSGGYFKFVEAATQNVYFSKMVGLWYLTVTIGVIIMGAGIVSWFINSALNIVVGITIPAYDLVLMSLMVPVTYLIIGYFKISSAAKTAIVVGVIQILFFTSFAIAFVVRTPYNGISYFDIHSSTNGINGFFLAMILGAFFSYGGYGSVVSLAEEVRMSRRVMKRAIVYAMVIMVAFETFAIYSIVAAAGPNISFLTDYASPSLYISKSYFGVNAGIAVFAVGLLGMVFSIILSGNSGARYAFALARDGLLPATFTKVHKKYGSPYIAVLWSFSGGLIGTALTESILVALFGEYNGLFYSWAIWGTALMVFSLLISIVTNSILAFFIRRIKKSVKVLTHVIGPSISSVIMGLAMYFSLIGLRGPMTWVYWVVISLLLADLVIIYLRRHKIRMDKFDDLIT